MKKILITGLAGILFTSLALNGQIQDKKYIKDAKDSAKYEQSWEGHTQKTPYMLYKERQEQLKNQKSILEKRAIEQTIPKEKQDSAVYHIIQKGDTYDKLADFYWGTDKEADEIQKLNPGVDYKKLKIGQKIRVK